MRTVWGAEHSLLPGLVKAMKLTGAHADVQAILQLGKVLDLAGRTEIGAIAPVILNSLHYPDLARGAVPVED